VCSEVPSVDQRRHTHRDDERAYRPASSLVRKPCLRYSRPPRSRSAPPPAAPPNACHRALGSRRRRSIALLETDPRTGSFRRNEDAPLDCDLLVVDETSMVDVPLMRAVLRAVPTRVALLTRKGEGDEKKL
jgi:ATP-dependent exoDNAse (exonuclease V) alpha subunit